MASQSLDWWTAAHLVGITRTAFNHLVNNKLEGISVDKMIQMKYLLGLGAQVHTVKIKKKRNQI